MPPAEAGSGFSKLLYPGLTSWAIFVPPFGLDFAAEPGRIPAIRLTLMRMQSAYDIAQTRKREKQIQVRRIHPAVHA